MITCSRAQAQFNDLLDGTLPSRRQSLLLAHLDNCPACKSEYDALFAVVGLVRQASPPKETPNRARILSEFRQKVSETDFVPLTPKFRLPFVPLGMAAAAMACLMMLVVLPRLNSPSLAPQSMEEHFGQSALPTSAEMDQMMGQHATQSAQVLAPNSEIHSEVATEAFSRLIAVPEED